MDDARLERIRGLAFDVDGVLTDGTVSIHASGDESKIFSVRDGTALLWCRLAGLELAVVSGRASAATTARMAELGIEAVYQGVRDKLATVQEWASERGLSLDEVLYMGDDHIDLPVFAAVGVSVAPADADPEVRLAATHVTERAGGDGAVREAIRWLLAATGRLEATTRSYREGLGGERP